MFSLRQLLNLLGEQLLGKMLASAQSPADAAQSALKGAADHLGLDRRHAFISGRLDGIEVSARLVFPAFDGIVACSAKFARSLEIGLDVCRLGPGDGFLGMPQQRVAKSRKLERFRVCARERGLAARLLRGDVEDMLVESAGANRELRIDDAGVELVLTAARPSAVVSSLRTCARLALAVERGKVRLPRTDHETALAATWEKVARTLGAEFQPAREELMLVLEFGRLRVGVRLDTERGWRTDLELTFADAFVDTLSVSKTEKHGKWELWTKGEIRLDDPAFDAAFVVRGAPEPRVRELLSENVRTRLCRLDALTQDLTLSEGALIARVGGAITDENELASMIQSVTTLGESLAPRARTRGPYR